ncbi:MAG: TolC family protein [Ignavibacteriaceae bacterium]|nr:TolC family protein [Ignavibacteriaceae bacterium]
MRKLLLIFLLPVAVYSQNFTFEEVLADSAGKAFVEKLVELAWNNYPHNKVFSSHIAIAEQNLTQTKWNWLNNLNLTYQYNPNFGSSPNDGSIVPRFGIGVSVNVGSIVLAPSRVSQAEEELKIAAANLETQKIFIRTEIRKRYSNYISAVERLKIRTKAVNNAESSLELIKKRFANGEVSLETLNQALNTLANNEELRVTSSGDLLFYKAAIEEYIGVPLESVK